MEQNCILPCVLLWQKAMVISINIDITCAITPPNVLEFGRNIAQTKIKYNSDWMWTGVVTKKLTGITFSETTYM